MAETEMTRRANWLDWGLAILTGVLLEILVELFRPIARLWSAPQGQIWDDIHLLGSWHWALKDILAGFELYVFLGFLVYSILWVRRGTEHCEKVLSPRGRQLVFLIAVFLTGVFITPHFHLGPDEPCASPKTSQSR
jgi:hypothetical protein